MAIPDSERCCGMCSHCHKGIPFNKKYFLCYCCDQLLICTTCHNCHPKSHSPWLKVVVDKATSRDGKLEHHRKCATCGTAKHARIDCNACELTACFDCTGTDAVRERWAEHAHKAYTNTLAPDDFCETSFDENCISCTVAGSMTHCSHCMEGEQYFSSGSLSILGRATFPQFWYHGCASRRLDLTGKQILTASRGDGGRSNLRMQDMYFQMG